MCAEVFIIRELKTFCCTVCSIKMKMEVHWQGHVECAEKSAPDISSALSQSHRVPSDKRAQGNLRRPVLPVPPPFRSCLQVATRKVATFFLL
jgi:hypothetical protein